jgi:tripartite-type tricarboxylate transporter receptor subunit TctC
MLGKPEIKERFDLLGVSPLTGTPTDLGNYLKFEISRWARLIKEADIKIQ